MLQIYSDNADPDELNIFNDFSINPADVFTPFVAQSVPSSDNRKKLRKKECNRRASRRYREKIRTKANETRYEIIQLIDSYERSKTAYEKAEQELDVLKNIVLNLATLS